MIELTGTGLHQLGTDARAGIARTGPASATLVILDQAGERELTVAAGDVFAAGETNWRVMAVSGERRSAAIERA